MTIRLIVISMALFGTLQLSAQDWSAWTASNNRDFQYRWSGNDPSESWGMLFRIARPKDKAKRDDAR